MLSSGCYVRYFSPSQARFPDWDSSIPPIPQSCKGLCGAGGDTCSADFRSVIDKSVAAGSEPDSDKYDLHATYVQLAAEDCSKTASGTLSVSWVRYISDGCACSDNVGCPTAARPSCRIADPEDCKPWPPNLPRGVCGPSSIGCSGPPGTGVPCTVSVGSQVCSGLTACAEGKYVCPISGCT